GYDNTPLVVTTSQLTLVSPSGGKLPDTSAGSVYGYQFSATGGDGQYAFTSSGSLPAGLSLSSSGALTGRPSLAQNTPYHLTIQVLDGSSHTAQGDFTLLVTDSQVPLTLLTHDLVYGSYSEPYLQELSATGGKPPYTWTLTGE